LRISDCYAVLSLNNQSFKLGLLRNFRIADTNAKAVTICGEYNPSTDNIELFDEALKCDCVNVIYSVSPENRSKK
jgi:hypothetical protein